MLLWIYIVLTLYIVNLFNVFHGLSRLLRLFFFDKVWSACVIILISFVCLFNSYLIILLFVFSDQSTQSFENIVWVLLKLFVKVSYNFCVFFVLGLCMLVCYLWLLFKVLDKLFVNFPKLIDFFQYIIVHISICLLKLLELRVAQNWLFLTERPTNTFVFSALVILGYRN